MPDGPDRPEAAPIPRIWLGNVPLSRVGFDEAVDCIARWAGEPPFRLVVTPNVDHVMHLQRNEAFRRAYEDAALSLPDGRPLLWAARYLALPSLEKVSGSDLVPALCRLGASRGWRVLFVGGRDPRELSDCLAVIAQRFEGLRVAGYFPPYGFERDRAESGKLVEAIERERPDLILFGCGAPKSEIWMAEHAGRIGRGVGIGTGASLRFLAGRERRAPRWMQRAGLEWCWRLAQDPARLWRRYLVEDMRFFPLVRRWKREMRG